MRTIENRSRKERCIAPFSVRLLVLHRSWGRNPPVPPSPLRPTSGAELAVHRQNSPATRRFSRGLVLLPGFRMIDLTTWLSSWRAGRSEQTLLGPASWQSLHHFRQEIFAFAVRVQTAIAAHRAWECERIAHACPGSTGLRGRVPPSILSRLRVDIVVIPGLLIPSDAVTAPLIMASRSEDFWNLQRQLSRRTSTGYMIGRR